MFERDFGRAARGLRALAIPVALVMASGGHADALSIRIDYNATTVTLPDGGTGDQEALPGRVQYVEGVSGNTFGDFSTLDVVGTRCSVCPSRLTFETQSAIDATALADNNGVPRSDLVLWVSDTGFTLPTALSWVAESDFVGIVDGVDVTYETFWDPANALFGVANPLAFTTLTGTDGADFDTSVGAATTAAPFSMTARITIPSTNFTVQAGTLQADAQLRMSPVPIPATLPLLAMSALGLFAVARRRRAS